MPQKLELSVNQGLPYDRLAWGKDTLVRTYLGAPTACTLGTGQSISITGASLSINGGAAIAPYTTPSGSLTTTTAQSNATTDPMFAVNVAPTGAGPFSVSFAVTVNYTKKSGTTSQTASAVFTDSKTFDQQINDLSMVVIPMGDGSAGVTSSSQFSSSAQTAVQNGMSTLSRIYPVRSKVGALGATGVGVKYTINLAAMLDLKAIPGAYNATLGKFCLGAGSVFDAVDNQLVSFRAAWNSANPNAQAQFAVGALDSAISAGSGSSCAEAQATPGKNEVWARAIPDSRTTGTSPTGGFLSMELVHTTGGSKLNTSTLHSPNIQADVLTPNRAWNTSSKTFVASGSTHSVMDYFTTSTNPWNNSTTFAEPTDFKSLMCNLGGTSTTDCASSVITGVLPAAGPRYTLFGTTDGTPAGTKLGWGPSTQAVETTPDNSSNYRVVQRAGGQFTNEGTRVDFSFTTHESGNDIATTTAGRVDYARSPIAPTLDDIQLWLCSTAACKTGDPATNGGTLLFSREKQANPPDVTSTSVSTTNYTNSAGVDDQNPDVSPDGKWVAWVVNSGNGTRIHVDRVSDAAHSQDATLPSFLSTGGAAFSQDPAWNPAGSKLAFVGQDDGDLYTIDVDTSGQAATFGASVTRIYDADPSAGTVASHPTWSPDGTEVAFALQSGTGIDIYKVPAVGGAATQLTSTGDASEPSWSKVSSTTLAYVRDQPVILLLRRQAAMAAKRRHAALAAPPAKAHHATRHVRRRAWSNRVFKPRSPRAPLMTLAADYTVNSALDTDDGACTTTAGGCTLREAINAANAASGSQTIGFNVGGGGLQTINIGSTPLPTLTDTTVIDGTTQPGSPTQSPRIQISGSTSGSGLDVGASADNSAINGLIINGFTGDAGIEVESGADGTQITGNYIGTNAAGDGAQPNLYGISINGTNTTIGGTSSGNGNVVSGNSSHGIIVHGGGSATIVGNLVGTNAAGDARIPNGREGIRVESDGNTIGGTTSGARNVVSGNSGHGILLYGAHNNTVQGNYAGTNAAGTAAIGNGIDGIAIDGGGNNTIGGTGAGNLASGNHNQGISVFGVDFPSTTGNLVQGNMVGTTAGGNGTIPNGGDGIRVHNGLNTLIGGVEPGHGNTVIGNGAKGVAVLQDTSSGRIATGNRISGNTISGNGSLGIDLGYDGVTPNDSGDTDSGANNLQNFPVLTSVRTAGGTGQTDIAGFLNSAANSVYRIEFFKSDSPDGSGYGEGAKFLGLQTVTTDANGNATFSVQTSSAVGTGKWVTATATSVESPQVQNTSEFSRALQVRGQAANPGVYTINPEATPIQSPTLLISGATDPAFSASGAILYVQNGNVYSKNGSATDQLSSGPDSSPSAGGPNGSVIAFDRLFSTGPQFDVMLITTTTNERSLTTTANVGTPNSFADLYFKCGDLYYPVQVRIPPSSFDQGVATFQANFDASLSCGTGGGTLVMLVTAGTQRTSFDDPQASQPYQPAPKPPTVAIYEPRVNFVGQVGGKLSLSGSGFDAEDGILPDNTLCWKIGPAGSPPPTTCIATGAQADIQAPTTPGDYDVTLQGTDSAGNVATATQTITLRDIDSTPPNLVVSHTPNNPDGTNTNSPVTVNISAGDAQSGLQSVTCTDTYNGKTTNITLPAVSSGAKTYSATASVSGYGVHVIDCVAKDVAGNVADKTNTASASDRVQIVYVFIGFLTPVKNPPGVNTGKAGQTYPMKWQLKDFRNTFVTSLSVVKQTAYQPVACSMFTGPPIPPLNPTNTSGNSTLRYDSKANQYIFNWATPMAPGCYVFFLFLNDDTVHSAYWQLTP